MKNKLAALLLASSLNAVAGDYSNIHPISVDKTGNYMALMEYGVQDGSGTTYVCLSVLDIAKNAYAPVYELIDKDASNKWSPENRRPIKGEISVCEQTDEYGSEDEQGFKEMKRVRAEALKKFRVTSEHYKLDKRKVVDMVEYLVYNPVTEVSVTSNNSKAKFRLGPFSSTDSPYVFKITEKRAPDANQVACYDLGEAKMLKATIKTPKSDPIVVQEDKGKIRSKVRSCPLGYAVESIIRVHKPNETYGGKIGLVALVRFYSPGFEGADSRYIPISMEVDEEHHSD